LRSKAEQNHQGNENAEMNQEGGAYSENQNAELLQILKDLKSNSDLEAQKEEFRKKYENYKKLFLNEKLEKDCKSKELEILKEAQTKGEAIPEIKELRIKYENLKQVNAKEYNLRKEKESKLEAANAEISK